MRYDAVAFFEALFRVEPVPDLPDISPDDLPPDWRKGTHPAKSVLDEGCNFEGSPDSLERTPCPTPDDRNGSHA
jgi:hypothetical protein